MLRRITLLVAVIAATADAGPSGAQAEVLFRQGRDLMKAGKYAEACAAFEQSQKLEPATTTLINLAGCREKAGQLATAWGLFLDAERQTRTAKDEAAQQLHDVARDHAKKLEPRVSKLTINVPANAAIDHLEVMRDKERVDAAMWNRALPIDGGTYTITARAPDHVEWTTTIVLAAEADTKHVDVPVLKTEVKPHDEVKPVVAPVTPRPAPAPAPASQRRDFLPFIVGGAGLALVGGAVGFSLWGDSTYDQAKAEMVDQARRDQLYSSANTKRYLAEGLGVAGVGCIGVAIYLYVAHRGETANAIARGPHVLVAPNGIAIGGAF